MKVKHDMARTRRSCLCSCSNRFLYDTRIDKEYYGRYISLSEKIVLRKLIGAVYDDIAQMLPGNNARRKPSENLRFTEETIQVAKRRLISHALKIINIDPADSKIYISDCCSCCSYGSTIPLCEHDRKLHRQSVLTSREVSGCSIETAKRVGNRQVKRIWSDLCTHKFNDWSEKKWRTETKQKLGRNYVTVFDYPFKYKTLHENKTTFFKNCSEGRQKRLVDEIKNENLTTLKIYTPVSRAKKNETGKIPFENINNGMKESIYIPKLSPPITHRPPYHFMTNPRISLKKINSCELNIKHRFDKDATGDTNKETVINIQPMVKRNHEKYDINLIRLALRRGFCTLILKPLNNKLDVIMTSKTVAKSLHHIMRTKLSSQSQSLSERSKIIKKRYKKNIAKVRHRSHKNFNIVNKKSNSNIPKLEVHLSSDLNLSTEGNKGHSENNVNVRNNLLAREVKRNKLNRNVFNVENTPQMSINLERQSTRSMKSTSPVAKCQFQTINKALEMKKLSEECNFAHKFIPDYLLDYKPEIDKFVSTCQNVIDKKPQVLPYACTPVFNGCIPHECLVSLNEIEPNKLRTSYCKKLGTYRSEPKSTISITQKHIKHMEITNVQTSLKSQINKISIDSKLNQAVQVNSSFSFDMEFYEKPFQFMSPFRHDAHIGQCGQQYREAGFQTIETHREGEDSRGNHRKTSEKDSYDMKNTCIESDSQSCFYTSKLHKMGENIFGTTVRKIQTKSFHQDKRQDFGFFISFERPMPCTSNKETMAKDFIIPSKCTIQRTKSNQIVSAPLINKSRQTNVRSSEIMNIELSQNRKIRHTYVANGNPYLIHDRSNKYRLNYYRPIELLRERAVKCKTSFSSSSSIISDTSTTISDSNHSFPSEKYKKYKENISHRVNSIYKSSFYAFNINVKNTRTDTRTNKLEQKKRLVEEPTFLTGRRNQAVRIGSNFRIDVEFSKSTIPARDLISERKHDRGAVPAPDFISERKQDSGALSTQTDSNKSVNQGTHTKKLHAVAQSHADMQHVGINTHPKRCFCTLKLHKMGRVYREKGVAAKRYRPKPNVLKETGTVTTKENSHHAAVVEVDLEPYECEPGTCIPGECDPQECLKRIKKKKNKTRAVEAHMAPGQNREISSTMAPGKKKEISTTMAPDQKKKQSLTTAPPGQKNKISSSIAPGTKKEISSKQACRITSNFSFSIEFVKYKPGEEPAVEEKPKGFIKGIFYKVKLNKKYRSILQKLACCKKKDLNSIQNHNSNKSVQPTVQYRSDDVKRIGMKTTMGTDVKPELTKERTTATHKKKDKKSKKVKEVGINSKIQYRLEDLDPYECEPGTCIQGECDPNVCFEIIKKRGIATTMRTDVNSDLTKEGTTTNHKTKDKKSKKVKEVGKNSKIRYRLEDLDPYECEPGTCIPGECDPNLCFEIIKKRGIATTMRTDVNSELTKEGTTINLKTKDKKSKKVKEVGKNSKIRYRLEDIDPYECEPGTCIPGECDPNVCFEIIKKRGIRTTMRTDVNSELTKEGTTINLKTKDKKSKKVKEVGKNSKIRYRLEDIDPYECEPGTCIPGECDPNVCFEIIKKRGMGISTRTDVIPKQTNEGTTTTHKKKDMKSKTVNTKSVGDSGIQGTKAFHHHDSPDIPEHYQKPSKTGAVLKRCFCTAKLHGIEVPPALAPPLLKSKKVKHKATNKVTKTPKVEGHSQISQTIKATRESNLLNLEPYECEPGVCVPGKCDPHICYERIKRGEKIKNISTQSKDDSISIKAGKHRADHESKSVKTGKYKAAMSETEKLQDGDHTSENLSSSVVRIGSSFEFNVKFSRQTSGMDGDGPDNTKPHTKRKMVSGTDVPPNPKTKKQKMVSGIEVPANPKTTNQKMVSANPKTKAKGTRGHLQPPVQSQDSQVVRGKTADQASGIGIVLRRCFCSLSLHGRSKKLTAKENTTKKKK